MVPTSLKGSIGGMDFATLRWSLRPQPGRVDVQTLECLVQRGARNTERLRGVRRDATRHLHGAPDGVFGEPVFLASRPRQIWQIALADDAFIGRYGLSDRVHDGIA